MNDQDSEILANLPYEELDAEAGLPNFNNQEERNAYYKMLKYFDKTEISEKLLNANAFIYEHPCGLSKVRKLYRLTFGAVESLSSLPAIEQEIQASSRRIDALKEEIKNWFGVLVKSLRQRKVHNPFGRFDALGFNSYHLLDAFSIYSRPTDYPRIEADLKESEEKNNLPFLIEPGETYLRESELHWFPWETDVDKRRENLKYADIADGVPRELRVGFELRFPEIKETPEEDMITIATHNKKIQTEKLPVLLTLQFDDELKKDTEKDEEEEEEEEQSVISDDTYDLIRRDHIVDEGFDRKYVTCSSCAIETTFQKPNVELPQVKKLKMKKIHKRRYK